MKKLMVALLMLAAMSSFALAQDFIGVFTDESGTVCDAELIEYVPVVLHVMAYIPSHPGGITAAEFMIANLPPNDGYPIGQITADWDTDLVIGDVTYDISLAFSTPVFGPFAHLGTLEFLMYDPAWVGADYVFTVAPGLDCDCLVVVDNLYDAFEVMGGQFTFNCTDVCYCIVPTATDETSWSAVKSLF